jgi:hypothetical protein
VRRSIRRVNDHDYHTLSSALNEAIDILNRNRTPDPAFVAACDTLKQSRAMIESAVRPSVPVETSVPNDLAA